MAERETGRGGSQKRGGSQERGADQGRVQGQGERGREEQERKEAEGLKARLDSLSRALDAQKSARPPAEDAAAPAAGSLGSAMTLGFRVLTEFVAAVVVGALIGWQIDVWTGATPVFLLVFLLFGTAAGFWNVYRIAVGPQGSKGLK
ncbi:AtpZ/AtpI family protein [Methylocapsa polymorpha]|uniref:AtpZ/AtpI family protein n=1 Tax=Methylocapsa polymorpha TaxID=3080828 RepID=A0ABZ0HNT5_9HYPH|nr:AtpZ/AtpI family protein [Methylocapsa sp. RX1]